MQRAYLYKNGLCTSGKAHIDDKNKNFNSINAPIGAKMAISSFAMRLLVQIHAFHEKKSSFLYKNDNFLNFFDRFCTIMTIKPLAMPKCLAIALLQHFQCPFCYQ